MLIREGYVPKGMNVLRWVGRSGWLGSAAMVRV